MEKKPGKYSVEWSTPNGGDVDWVEFRTLRDAKAYLKKHANDEEKFDIHIKVWNIFKVGEPPFEDWDYEVIDSIEKWEVMQQ